MHLEQPLLLLLIPPALLLVWFASRGAGRGFTVARAAILVMLMLALANPVQIREATAEERVPGLTLLDDQTTSMDLFEGADWGSLNASNYETITLRGNSSRLGDAIRDAASRGGAVLIHSDGRVTGGASLREAALYAAERKVPIYAVRPDARAGDVSVEVRGPKNVVKGENRYVVEVRSTRPTSYGLKVSLDGEDVMNREVDKSSRVRRFNLTLDVGRGEHVIEAKVEAGEDHFAENSRFTKSVWGAPEPPVLLLNGGASLEKVLRGGYDVTQSKEVENLGKYRAVVINDVPAEELDDGEVRRLTSFVAEGGGLVVVGGTSSYNFGGYLNSSIEDILPVRSSPSRYFGGLNLVLVIDVSDSTREGASGSGVEEVGILDVEKSNALNLLDELQPGDRVAAVIYGGESFTVLPSRGGWVTAGNSAVLREKLRRLTPSGGGTALSRGLSEAVSRLGAVGGSKSVVVLSDGGINDEEVRNSKEEVEALRRQNAEVAFVKVRSGVTNNENFDELARRTGVPLHEVKAGQVASVEIDRGPEPPGAEGRDSFRISKSKAEHFVTSGLSLNSSVTGYNDVTPKPASDLLAVTDTGRPVLTTWSFGLGRVASLSTDDGSAWASQLYSRDGKLVTRTVNWAVEDPRERDGLMVKAEDGWLGSPLDIRVEADEPPELAAAGSPLGLSREDGYYTGSLVPKERGVLHVGGYPVAVNYPLETRETGFNPELRGLLPATGGRVMESLDEVTADELAASVEVRTVEEESFRPHLLLASLILLVVEVTSRRWREVRRS